MYRPADFYPPHQPQCVQNKKHQSLHENQHVCFEYGGTNISKITDDRQQDQHPKPFTVLLEFLSHSSTDAFSQQTYLSALGSKSVLTNDDSLDFACKTAPR